MSKASFLSAEKKPGSGPDDRSTESIEVESLLAG